MEYCYKIHIQNIIRWEGHTALSYSSRQVRVSFWSLVLTVATFELKENLNYLQRFAIAKTCPEGLVIQNEIQIAFPALLEKNHGRLEIFCCTCD